MQRNSRFNSQLPYYRVIRPGSPYRTRGLDQMNRRFWSGAVEQVIIERIGRCTRTRVLEIGCGEGIALLQLRRLFPSIELHGINREVFPYLSERRDFGRVAVRSRLYSRAAVKKLSLPWLHCTTFEASRFGACSFDVIVSQMAVHYIERKDEVIEKAWRMLRPGGWALLHIDSLEDNYPAFLRHDMPRLVLYRRGKMRGLELEMRRLRGLGFHIVLMKTGKKDSPFFSIVMQKNTMKSLRLGWSFDPQASLDLSRLESLQQNYADASWGFRSVYHI